MAHQSKKFNRGMYVTSYQLARDGLSDEQIAKTHGVTGPTFRTWCKKDVYLAAALQQGRRGRESGDEFTFHEYVYDHLSPHLKGLWEEINQSDKDKHGIDVIESILEGHGTRARQQLFIYALTQSCFNISQSLRKVGLSKNTLEKWKHSDPEFAEMISEIHWHKDNFFEQALMCRVAAGDTSAIIHVAKTKLRSRGYNEKIEIEHTGMIQHEHNVNVMDLKLPIEARKAILEALRDHQATIEAKAQAIAVLGVPA